MFQKSSLRIYLIVVNLVVIFVILQINLFLPKFTKILFEASPGEAKAIQNKIFNLTIGLLVFIFLFDLYFLNAEKRLKEEEEKAKTILKTNPADQFAQKKLAQIEKKRRTYLNLIEIVFIIAIGITGITVGLFSEMSP